MKVAIIAALSIATATTSAAPGGRCARRPDLLQPSVPVGGHSLRDDRQLHHEKDPTLMTTSKITRLALIATATVAAAIAFAATASAGVAPTFKSPSGNIACWVADDFAGCQVLDHTYASWPGGCSSRRSIRS